jgi:choice-of-anchor B domain-containing protein
LNRSTVWPKALLTALAVSLAACGGGGSSGGTAPPNPAPGPSSGPAACTAGTAGNHNCSGISLRKRVSLADMGGGSGNDLWGWIDPSTGREYALMGLNNGVSFVDVSDPENPTIVGRLPTQTIASSWRDIKIYEDHAFVVADAAGAHGMQVFDLSHLRNAVSPATFSPDVVYADFGSAHNIAIDEDTGFAYVVGSNTCNEGLHMIDVSVPINPLFAGCHSAFEVHDTVCTVYHGPDAAYVGNEICFNAAKDRVEIVDVSVKGAAATLGTTVYPDLAFVHQAWPTDDHRYLFVNDEIDEGVIGGPTRTFVIDITDLDAPAHVYTYDATTTSRDHNLYVFGNRVFQANYTTGLRVLEFMDPGLGEISEVAYFDTYQADDSLDFDGAWSVYPYFPSGNIIVSDVSNGLFILTLD